MKKVIQRYKKQLWIALPLLATAAGIILFLMWATPNQGEIVEMNRTTTKRYLGVSENGNHKYHIESHLHPVNYIGEDGKWHEYDTNLTNKEGGYKLTSSDHNILFPHSLSEKNSIELSVSDKDIKIVPGVLEYVNNEGKTQKIADPDKNAKTEVNENTIIYLDAYGKGIDLKFTSTTTQVVKEIIIHEKNALPTPTIEDPQLRLHVSFKTPADTKIELTDPQNPLGEKTVWSEDTDIQILDGTHITDNNISSDDRNYDNVVDENDNILFGLVPAFAIDSANPPNKISSNPNDIEAKNNLSFTLHPSQSKNNDEKQFNTTVTVPYTWLDNASYPVTIDPSVDFQVNAAANDGIWTGTSSLFNTTSSFYTGGWFGAPYSQINAFARFTNVDVPQGALINQATMTVTANETRSTTTVNSIIRAIDEDDAAAPTDYAEATGATRTSASTAWSNIEAFTDNVQYTSPDISSVIQEIVDRSGWESGNSIVLYGEDNGSTQVAGTYRRADPYDTSPTDAVQMSIIYEEPALHWKFNEGYGTTANDSSLLGNSGTISGAAWVEESLCAQGRCLRFDGTDDFVSRADDSDLDFASGESFTLQAWIKHGVQTSGQDIIVSKYNEAGYKLIMESDGDITCALDYDSTWSPTDSVTSTAANYDDSAWHQVTCVKDANSSLTLYIDGVQVGIDSSLTASSLANSDPFYVGVDADGTSNDWKGMIDDVRLYRKAATADEAESAYTKDADVLGASTFASISDGLVGYWKMDETSWTIDCSTETVIDSSGNGFNGQACPSSSGVSLTTGKFGNAGSFDNTGDNINIADQEELDIGDGEDFSTSFWVYRSAAAEGDTVFAKKNGTSSGNTGYLFLCLGGGICTFYLSDGTEQYTLSTTNALPTGEWVHFAIVLDKDSQENSQIYINGESENATSGGDSLSSVGSAANNASFNIGSESDGQVVWNGNIDEFRVYNRTLSPNEVADLYSFATAPVGYWKFEEGSGTTANDSSGNGNSGTFTDTPVWTAGKIGKSLSFDGSDDDVTVSSTFGLGANSVTVSTWVYLDSTSKAGSFVKIGNDTTGDGYGIGVGGSSFDNTGNNLIILYEAIAWKDTNVDIGTGWHHVAFNIDTANFLRAYIDGKLVYTDSSSTARAPGSFGSADTQIGGYSTRRPNVRLDDVKVYNYARTPGQITEDMNAGHPVGGSPVGSQVGYWKFDENNGTSTDNSGNQGSSLDGTITGATWTNEGKAKTALEFDANDDRVSVSSSSLLTSQTEGSISAWVYSDNTDGTEDIIYSENVSTGQVFRLDKSTSNLFEFAIRQSNGTTPAATDTSTLSANTWYHVVGTFNQNTGTIKLYVNGVLKDTNTSWDSSFTTTVNSVLIGDISNAGTFGWGGRIDEVKAYTTELTADQVKIDYNAGKSLVLGALSTDASGNPSNSFDRSFCPPGDTTSDCMPIGYWNYEEGSGITAFDRSGNNNNASHSNSPTYAVGKIGKSMNYVKASSQYSTVTDTSLLRPGSGDWTWMAWVKVPNANTRGGIVVKYNSGTNAGFAMGICATLSCSSDGQNFFASYSSSGSVYRTTITTTDYIDGNWVHVAAVANQSEDDLTLYINGQEASQTQGSNGSWPNITDTSNMRFGDMIGHYLNGQLDEIKIYDYVRTPEQIAWDYSNGKPVAQFKLDECSGTTANSSILAGNVGTITIGGGGSETSVGNCNTSSTAWGDGVDGKRNYSLSFDGTDDYISGDDTDFPTGNNSRTFSAWIYPENYPTSGSHRTIFNYGTATTNQAFGVSLFNNSGTQQISVFGWGNDYNLTHTVDLNTWTHLLITYDGDTVTVFENGIEIGSSSGFSAWNTTLNDYNIGSNISESNTFDGKIDDLRLYIYELSQQQIKTTMNDGAIRWGPNTGAPN